MNPAEGFDLTGTLFEGTHGITIEHRRFERCPWIKTYPNTVAVEEVAADMTQHIADHRLGVLAPTPTPCRFCMGRARPRNASNEWVAPPAPLNCEAPHPHEPHEWWHFYNPPTDHVELRYCSGPMEPTDAELESTDA